MARTYVDPFEIESVKCATCPLDLAGDDTHILSDGREVCWPCYNYERESLLAGQPEPLSYSAFMR